MVIQCWKYQGYNSMVALAYQGQSPKFNPSITHKNVMGVSMLMLVVFIIYYLTYS